MTPIKIKRIFWVDPNLTKDFGHPIEATNAVKNYFTLDRSKRFLIITNKIADESVGQIVNKFFPTITNTCFINLDNNGEIFYRDLLSLHKRFSFSPSDLIIISTCFTNEIMGVGKFSARTRLNLKIVLILHQLLPPAPEFLLTTTFGYRKIWENKLKKSLTSIKKFYPLISVWTTESQKLNNSLNAISSFKIGRLPLPISFYPEYLTPLVRNHNSITISFLGDGRYEKGLLLLMRAILTTPLLEVNFILQNVNARGYSPSEYQLFLRLKNELSSINNVSFINKSLGHRSFHKEVSQADIIIFPYHPLSYDCRISGVYIQAVMYRKLCIVSANTWLAEQARKFKSGLIFNYHLKNSQQVVKNIGNAIKKAIETHDKYAVSVAKQSEIYRKINSPMIFFKEIYRYYKLK